MLNATATPTQSHPHTAREWLAFNEKALILNTIQQAIPHLLAKLKAGEDVIGFSVKGEDYSLEWLGPDAKTDDCLLADVYSNKHVVNTTDGIDFERLGVCFDSIWPAVEKVLSRPSLGFRALFYVGRASSGRIVLGANILARNAEVVREHGAILHPQVTIFRNPYSGDVAVATPTTREAVSAVFDALFRASNRAVHVRG
jgi:hypothetical protein